MTTLLKISARYARRPAHLSEAKGWPPPASVLRQMESGRTASPTSGVGPIAGPVGSLVVYGADRRAALECRNFLLKPQDPIIETLQRSRLNCLDHPVKLAQGPSPSCAGRRWRLYCSHFRSPKLSGDGVSARTNEHDSQQELSVLRPPAGELREEQPHRS